MRSLLVSTLALVTLSGMCPFRASGSEPSSPEDRRVQAVIDEVDQACRQRTIYMLGPQKAKRLAELVRQAKPSAVVECGTAVGYSGMWIARELRAAGHGKLITIEIRPETAREAEANFRKAGLAEFVTVKIGDAKQVCRELDGPIDFALIDCNASNYYPCFEGLEKKFSPGATVVADNADISARGMEDYLRYVREKYQSRTEWFDLDLPWAKRDAMEITVIRAKKE